jgi:hypothetical protein
MIDAGAAHTLVVDVGTGTLDYTEKRNIEVVKRRGLIQTAREGDEVEMDVSFQFVWELLTAHDDDDPPTIEDVLKHRGQAAFWVSTNPDPDAPFCIDLVIVYKPPCPAQAEQAETIALQRFQYEELAHQIKDGAVDCKGKCLATQAAENIVVPLPPSPATPTGPTAPTITPPAFTPAAPTGTPSEFDVPLVPAQFKEYFETGAFLPPAGPGSYSVVQPPFATAQSTDSGYSPNHWVPPALLQYQPFPANEVTACIYTNLGNSSGVACVGIRLTQSGNFFGGPVPQIYFFKGFGGKVGLVRFGYLASEPAVTILSSVSIPLDQALWMRIKGNLYQVSPDTVTWTTVANQQTLGGVPSLFAYNPAGAPQDISYVATSFWATYVRADLGYQAFTSPVWSETNSPVTPGEWGTDDAAHPGYSGSNSVFYPDGSLHVVAPASIDTYTDQFGNVVWPQIVFSSYGRGADRVTACIHPTFDAGGVGCVGIRIGQGSGEFFYKGFNGHVGTCRFNSGLGTDQPKVIVFTSIPMAPADCLWMRIYGTLYQTSPDGVTWTTVGTRPAAVLGSTGVGIFNPAGSLSLFGAVITSFYATYPGQTSR